MSATDHELLRLDYDHTAALLGRLNDVRFKLLAFVPTVAGASVGLLSRQASRAELLAVGLIGLAATLGVLLYDHRNNEHYARANARARELERRLGFLQLDGAAGAYDAAPAHPLLGRRVALGLVYGAAIGAWAYIVVWGALAFAETGSAKTLGALAGAAVGAAVLAWESRTA